MYQPTSRLLTVLELLQARPVIAGSELARRLEVDGRTVRRYIVTLQDLGIPVEAVHGRYGGYRLRPGFKLPPLMFTEDEAMAVTLGLIAARQLGLAVTAPATDGALAKLERVLPDPVSMRVRALEETIRLAERSAQPTPAGVLLTLSTAAFQRQRAWLRYRSAEGVESEREFDAYGVVFFWGRWYAVGFDHSRDAMRTFRLDRVIDVAPRDESFDRPRTFDAVAYLTENLAAISWGVDVEAWLDMTLDQAHSWIPRHRGQVEAVDGGGVRIRFSVDDPGMAARWLVWLGVPFRVISPASVRDEVRHIARDLLAMADADN